jgi:hypothetical protein
VLGLLIVALVREERLALADSILPFGLCRFKFKYKITLTFNLINLKPKEHDLFSEARRLLLVYDECALASPHSSHR